MNLLLLLLSLACPDRSLEGANSQALAVAAQETTVATFLALGPHILEAHTEVVTERPEAPTTTVKNTSRLRWQDDRHWQWIRERDGARLSEVRVFGGKAWSAVGTAGLKARPDAEPLRAELGLDADPWVAALGAAESRILYTEAGEEDIEGRKVWRYLLALSPGTAGGRRSRDVISVDGQVWIDQTTAVRLAGDVTLKTTSRDQTRTTRLQFAATHIGGDAGVEAP